MEIKSGRHTLYGDLMPAAGGSDQGPSPKEYVMAAVTSCTVMVSHLDAFGRVCLFFVHLSWTGCAAQTMRIYFDAMVKAGKFTGTLNKVLC